MKFMSNLSGTDSEIPEWLEEAWDRELNLFQEKSTAVAPEIPDDEKRLYLQALDARNHQRYLSALFLYAEILHMQLQNRKTVIPRLIDRKRRAHLDPKSPEPSSPEPIQFTIKQMLLVLYNQYPETALELQDQRYPVIPFFDLAVRKLPEPDNAKMWHLFQAWGEYITAQNLGSDVLAEYMYLQILWQMERKRGPNHTGRNLIMQRLASLYVHELNGYRTALPWSEQQPIIIQGLAELERTLGNDDARTLRFCSKLGRRYIREGVVADGESMLLRAYQGQKRTLGEQHEETIATLDALYSFYKEQERYIEAEALLRAAISENEMMETSVSTDDYTFRKWSRQLPPSLQAKLASLCTPGPVYFWEDSRIYLRTLRHLKMIPLLPPDPFPRGPAKITLRENEVEVYPPLRHTLGDPLDLSILDQIRTTEIWEILLNMAKDRNHDNFHGQNHLVDLEQEKLEEDSCDDSTGKRNFLTESRIPAADPLTFWIFVEDQERMQGSDYLDLSNPNTSLQWTSRASRRKGRVYYHFDPLQKSKTQWMVLVLDSLEGDPTEPDINILQATSVWQAYYPRWRESRLSKRGQKAASTEDLSLELTYAGDFDTYRGYDRGDLCMIELRAKRVRQRGCGPQRAIESAAVSFLSPMDLSLGQDAKFVPDLAYRPSWFDTRERARCFSETYRFPRSMKYAIEEHDDSSIGVSVPYVPYKHFQMSEGYRHGYQYTEYVELLAYLWHPNRFQYYFSALKKNLCKTGEAERIELPVWPAYPTDETLLDDSQSVSNDAVEGFFNDVPGDAALLDIRNLTDNFNLVSSAWVDWKRFTLHKPASGFLPQLKMPNHETVTCHGYISGGWTNLDLEKRWNGLQVFVVDAVFVGCTPIRQFNFLLSPAALGTHNLHHLSPTEKRFLSGQLNPTLFRYAPRHYAGCGASIGLKKKRVVNDPIPSELDSFWEEMNRREQWDRRFERDRKANKKGWGYEEEEACLNREKEAEDRRRQEWDDNRRKSRETPSSHTESLFSSV